MAACWLLCLAVFSYPLSAERVAHKRILHKADSFLTRRHGAREFVQDSSSESETSNGTSADVKVGLPKCSDGVLQLDGVYEATGLCFKSVWHFLGAVKKQEEVLAEGPSCAELLLWAPVRFQGNLVLAGQLNVKAAGDGGRVNASCIAVNGNFTLRPEARLSIQGCQNEADEGDAGYGGCLHVGRDAELLGGQLLLRDCAASTSTGLGGGIYVRGRTGICCFDLENAVFELAREEL
ncbi:unnamed protein product [Symbiodinium necroappetens]|uniref:Right handed beta helix domain-containing protein n=1 Tax=Symbiodinium necroappetens TaxID=1628268 RepID=A0A812XZV9_9DINO|nr:unnamed protein product [Symbiodinium necroappetens]